MSENGPSNAATVPPKRKSCLPLVIAAIAMIALIGLLGYESLRRKAMEDEREQELSIAKEVQEVKQGATSALIWPPVLATRLANDDDCVRNLREIVLSMVDLQEPGYKDISRLKNVQTITIYSCENVDKFLPSIQSMPNLSELKLQAISYTAQTADAIASHPQLELLWIDVPLREAEIEDLDSKLPAGTTIEVYDDHKLRFRREGSQR